VMCDSPGTDFRFYRFIEGFVRHRLCLVQFRFTSSTDRNRITLSTEQMHDPICQIGAHQFRLSSSHHLTTKSDGFGAYCRSLTSPVYRCTRPNVLGDIASHDALHHPLMPTGDVGRLLSHSQIPLPTPLITSLTSSPSVPPWTIGCPASPPSLTCGTSGS
jgi:hypothetical protein